MINLRDVVLSSGGIQVGSRQADVTGLEEIGAGLDTYNALRQQKDERDAAAFNVQAQTDLQIFGVEAMERARVESDAPDNITKNFMDLYEQRYQELRSSAPNDTALRQLEDRYSQLKTSYGTKAMGMQVAESQNYRKQSAFDAYASINGALADGRIDYTTAKNISKGVMDSVTPFLGASEKVSLRREQRESLANLYVSSLPDQEKYTIFSKSKRKIPEYIDNIFQVASRTHGIPYEVFATIAQIESRMNPSAQNPKSSAGGLFQQLDDNAKYYGVDNKKDPAQSTEGFAKFFNDNKPFLQRKLGREPTNAEMYLAHQQGAKGATDLLLNPTALATEVVGEKSVLLNGGSEDMTSAEFAAMWLEKYDSVEGFVGEGVTYDPNISAFKDLSAKDKISLMSSLKNYADVQGGIQAIQDGRALYMDKGKRTKAADVHYKEYMQGISSRIESESDLLSESIDYVNSFNVIPTELKNTVNGMMSSQDSGQLMLGADFVAKVAESNPNVADGFGDDVINKAILVSNLNAQGVPFSSIAERIKESQLARPEDIKSYSSLYDEANKKVSDLKYIQNTFDGGNFAAAPDVPVPMLNDFNREAKAMLPYFQDVKQARKSAMTSIQRSWGISEIGGSPRWVKGAPELRFGAPGMTPAENSEWMRGQIVQQFQSQYLVSDVNEDYNIVVKPSRTDANYYTVHVIDDDGVMNSMLWKPDWQSSAQAKKLSKKIEEQIVGSRAEFLENRAKALSNKSEIRPIDWKIGRPFQ